MSAKGHDQTSPSGSSQSLCSFVLAVACPPRMTVRTRAPVSEFLSVERLEFFATGFAEVA
jgi:hypothetical protein